MKVLFLSNFRVEELDRDDPQISPPDKFTNPREYWFFKHMKDVHVEVLDNREPWYLGWLSRIVKIQLSQAFKAFRRRHEFEVIVSHSFSSAFVLSFLRSLVRDRDPRHYIIDIGSLNGGKERRFQIAIIRFALKSVSGLIYHSTVNETFYERYFPKTRRKFIPFGTEIRPKDSNQTVPLGDFALSIGYAFRDYDTLVRSWNGIDIPLKIVGTTSLDIAGRENIQQIEKLTLPVLEEYIRSASLVILPITDVRYSVGQMTLTQCMALGKAIIASRSNGIRDYCIDQKNCLMYECGDEASLRAKVEFLLAHPDFARKLGQAALEEVATRFNEKAMADAIFEFIQNGH